MKHAIRLKALARLANSNAKEAEELLREEMQKVSASLQVSTQYDVLSNDLDILETIASRFSSLAANIIRDFIIAMETTQITYSPQEQPYEQEIAEYSNASTLIVRAIEILQQLRYLETKTILRLLLELSRHESQNIRSRALEGLRSLADFDIYVFYGSGHQEGVGAIPQNLVLDELEVLPDSQLSNYINAILVILEGFLSPTIRGTSWSAKAVTLSQAATPATPIIEQVRNRSIHLLKRLFGIATTVPQKLKVLSEINGATRRHGIGQLDAGAIEMFAKMP